MDDKTKQSLLNKLLQIELETNAFAEKIKSKIDNINYFILQSDHMRRRQEQQEKEVQK